MKTSSLPLSPLSLLQALLTFFLPSHLPSCFPFFSLYYFFSRLFSLNVECSLCTRPVPALLELTIQWIILATLAAQMVKRLPAMWET